MTTGQKTPTLRSMLSPTRHSDATIPDSRSPRSPFESDIDRITFDPQLRLMADKTQVHKNPEKASIRSRLSHSLEVSRVARSLGRDFVEKSHEALTDPDLSRDTQDILQAAGLLHDIGMPPFGHAGENAISHYFKTSPMGRKIAALVPPETRREFERYDSNAQTLRYATKLGGWSLTSGMNITAATLATMVKYPHTASHGPVKRSIYSTGVSDYRIIARHCNLPETDTNRWQRHPLSYLSEASDDITYTIVDIEDALTMHVLPYPIAIEMLTGMVSPIAKSHHGAMQTYPPAKQIAYLRSQAISNLISLVSEYAHNSRDSIMSGTLGTNIIEQLAIFPWIRYIKDYFETNIYRTSDSNSLKADYHAIGSFLEHEQKQWPEPKTPSQAIALAHRLCDALNQHTDTSCTSAAQNDQKPKRPTPRSKPKPRLPEKNHRAQQKTGKITKDARPVLMYRSPIAHPTTSQRDTHD